MLEVKDLDVYYSKAHVLRKVSLKVEEGEIVSVIGPNGAGKTTLFCCISGLKDFQGSIRFREEELPKKSAAIVNSRIIHCPEERHLFPFLSVLDNLMLGAYKRSRNEQIRSDLETVYELFPILEERKRQVARTLSGGEQQMLAIGRALMGKPDLLLMDEPTLGLAPIVRQHISEAIEKINRAGVTVLLAEQNVVFALEHSDRVYLLETGCVVKQGTVEEFKEDEYIRRSYLGG